MKKTPKPGGEALHEQCLRRSTTVAQISFEARSFLKEENGVEQVIGVRVDLSSVAFQALGRDAATIARHFVSSQEEVDLSVLQKRMPKGSLDPVLEQVQKLAQSLGADGAKVKVELLLDVHMTQLGLGPRAPKARDVDWSDEELQSELAILERALGKGAHGAKLARLVSDTAVKLQRVVHSQKESNFGVSFCAGSPTRYAACWMDRRNFTCPSPLLRRRRIVLGDRNRLHLLERGLGREQVLCNKHTKSVAFAVAALEGEVM